MIRNTIPGTTLRRRTYYSTYKGRTRKGIRPIRIESNTSTTPHTAIINETAVTKSNQPILFSTWWTTTYMPIIENSNELVKQLHPTETTSLYNTINTFINTLNDTIVSYYHLSYQIFSPDNEFHGNSVIYIITTSILYKMTVSFTVSGANTYHTTAPFEKVLSYSPLSSEKWDIISTHPQSMHFLQPLQMENGFQKISQQMSDFEALFRITI